MKIYNEIVIDMNPESPTFEETIYEDSFEYSGDMMLLEGWTDVSDHPSYTDTEGNVWTLRVNVSFGTKIIKQQQIFKNGELHEGKTIERGANTRKQANKQFRDHVIGLGVQEGFTIATTHEVGATDEEGLEQFESTAATTDWGAQGITSEMFISTGSSGKYPSTRPAGTPRTLKEVYNTLDPILTGITGPELVNQINDMFPKFVGVSEEEKEFKKEDYEADVYGLSKEVSDLSAKTNIYGGMGSDIRSQITGQKDIAKRFEQAGKKYKKSIYDLEKTAGQDYETELMTAIGDIESPFAVSGVGGVETQVTPWEEHPYFFTGSAKKGGKVPTFAEILSKIPEAGGS